MPLFLKAFLLLALVEISPRLIYRSVATAASTSRRTGATLQMSPNILCVRIFVCSQHPSPARASRAGSDIQIVTLWHSPERRELPWH